MPLGPPTKTFRLLSYSKKSVCGPTASNGGIVTLRILYPRQKDKEEEEEEEIPIPNPTESRRNPIIHALRTWLHLPPPTHPPAAPMSRPPPDRTPPEIRAYIEQNRDADGRVETLLDAQTELDYCTRGGGPPSVRFEDCEKLLRGDNDEMLTLIEVYVRKGDGRLGARRIIMGTIGA